jgi:hypothetical protein
MYCDIHDTAVHAITRCYLELLLELGLCRSIGGHSHHQSVWTCRMSLKNIDLTTALRPSLLPDEVLLFVQDNVGLYEG